MFKYNGNHGYLPVVGNSLVIIKTPMQHKVNPVLSPIISRLSIQSFIK
jgi:Rps23 Pro-64 3,4-dihydroxylase Tpa1-like proline 4-hydroxylase